MKKNFKAYELDKIGRVRGRILENTNDDGTKRYSVDIFRTYRVNGSDDSGANAGFKDTFNFSKEDLRCVSVLADDAREKISNLEEQ